MYGEEWAAAHKGEGWANDEATDVSSEVLNKVIEYAMYGLKYGFPKIPSPLPTLVPLE